MSLLFGAALILTWLILLVRFPLRALPLSAAALCGLLLIAAGVLWQEHRETQRLQRLQLSLTWDPDTCPADRPLHVQLRNDSDEPLLALDWRIAARLPGEGVDLVQDGYRDARYQSAESLPPGQRWQTCLALPALRPGYRPQTLQFSAERLQGSFGD